MSRSSTTTAGAAAGIVLALATALLAPHPAVARQTAPSAQGAPPPGGAAPADEVEDNGWPRLFEAEGHDVIVYAPQIDEWPGFDRITFRAAVSVAPKGSDARTFGIIRVSADTDIAYEEKLVVLTGRKLEELTFPDVDPADAERLHRILVAAMPPERPQTISLDRLVAGMDPAQVAVRKVEVNLAPPRIFTSEKPAVLVIFLGKARFKPVPGSDLLFAINTNWDVFLDPSAQKHYLLVDRSWLETADLAKGPWVAARALPPSLSKLPADDNWNDVRAAIPGTAAAAIPAVFVSYEPAELIVTDGAPELEPIEGSPLMQVANTENQLFYEPATKQYYLLTAGRWFRSAAVAGPWTAASGSLPDSFRSIPEEAELDDVLAAVPGTAAANEAMIMASIPQKATVNRAELTIDVTYDGAPEFRPIESTSVKYAYNTPFNVFLVDGKYYCCHNAVWFEAPAPNGAWIVCDAVPKAIYTIPPTSPKHNVTYVTVYESTPTTVVTGYTSGYSGATVATTGAVMFGLGVIIGAAIADDDCCWGYHYPACYFSYGCGASWHGGHGGYVCAVGHYGPYGGAGRVAAYNPATGVYSRGGYAYGPRGAAGYRTAYNPATGVAAGRAGGVTPYGSWGRSVVSNGDEWVRGGHRTTSRGTVGAIQGSEGGAAITARGRYGNGATIAKDKSGDYYAAKDGKVYKRDDDGWEQTRNGSSRGASPNAAGAPPANRTAGKASKPTERELQKQATSRSRGEKNTARANQSKRGGGRAAPQRGGGGRRR